MAQTRDAFRHQPSTAMPPSVSVLLPGIAPVPAVPGRNALDAGASVRIDRVVPADASVLMALCDEQVAEHAGRWRAQARRDAMPLEFHEALFDPPVRAWAWLVRVDGRDVGYAGATAGVAFPEGAYYLNVEALYLRPAWRLRGLEQRLLAQVHETARQLGCTHLAWRQPQGTTPHARAAVGGVIECRVAVDG